MTTQIDKIRSLLVNTFFFLLPVFVFPFIQDPITSAKWYFMGLFCVLYLVLSAIRIALTKKMTFDWSISESFLMVFGLLAMGTLLFVTPNKIQGFISPLYGLGTVLGGIVLYFAVKENKSKVLQYLFFGVFLASILYLIVFVFNPFARITLPPYFSFISLRSFNPAGTTIDGIILFGFFALTSIGSIIQMLRKEKKLSSVPIPLGMSLVIVVATVASVFALLQSRTYLSPLLVSWLTSVESLKNPITALLGFGFDNFLSVFTRVKPLVYNTQPYWTENYRYGANIFLHVWTETGLLSVVSLLIFILYKIVQSMRFLRFSKKDNHTALIGTDGYEDHLMLIIGLGFLFLMGLIFPPTFMFWILLFVVVGQIPSLPSEKKRTFDIESIPLLGIILGIFLISMAMIGGYYMSKGFLSDFYFKRGTVNIKSAKNLYDNTRQAIQINPYNENYRLQFAQINLSLANELAKKKDLSDKDRQTILQAIQGSIREAKALVTLNPQKASSWLALASVYRNIIGISKGSDVWAITAYQRAITADPANPGLRFVLGTLYYSLKNYPSAIESLQQAIQLRSDQPNYYYNLAWAFHQNNQDDKAVQAMNTVMSLLQKGTSDFKKAETERNAFQKQVESYKKTKSQEVTPESSASGSLQVQQPQPTLSPQIDLPQDAGIATGSGR